MVTVSLVLLVLAFVAFIIAAAGLAVPPRVNFIAIGLALWSLSAILSGVKL